MNLPNLLTISRIGMAPIFFILLFLPQWTGGSFLPFYGLAWVVFFYIEISDIADGVIARKNKLITELGKLLDPFSDVISRLSYFIAFTALDIMPAWMLLLIVYREFGITFLRMILFNRGVALAARGGGKLKAVFYAISGGAGLLVIGARGFSLSGQYQGYLEIFALVCFGIAILASLGSFIDYLRVFIKIVKEKPESKTEQK